MTSQGFVDLNDSQDVNAIVNGGGYDALMYIDTTGEGWVSVEVLQLSGIDIVESRSRPAYVLLSAPDFFPSCGQRELSAWAASEQIPASFRSGEIWGVRPTPLSAICLPANLQLPNSPFDPSEDTITAVLSIGRPTGSLPPAPQTDTLRGSTLPDDAAGVFAPGWDVSVDVKGPIATGIPHLAAYGLGSPFPEDAKLCAALSTFWPAVSPDVFRTMSPHTGNPRLRGSVAPLTDEEIGQVGILPWDGVSGPKIVQVDGREFLEMASFLNTDYVANAVENRFSPRLLARITSEEYERRVLAAARVHWMLSGGTGVARTRQHWLFLSFQTTAAGDPVLQVAQGQAGHVFHGAVYWVEVSFVPDGDPTIASPRGPRFRLLPLQQRNSIFVSPTDPVALRRRATDLTWARVRAE